MLQLKRLGVVCNRGGLLQCNASDISVNLGNGHVERLDIAWISVMYIGGTDN